MTENNFDVVLDEVSEGISEGVSAAINNGFTTLGDAIKQFLANSGTQQASAVEVTVNHGPTRVVISDSDPIFNEPVAAGAEVKIAKVNSADAGRV